MSGAVHLLPLYVFILYTEAALRVTKFFFFVGKKMAGTDRDEVITVLKACVLSTKEDIPVKNLNRKLYIHHQSPFINISLKI
jgi:hypothetical protein